MPLSIPTLLPAPWRAFLGATAALALALGGAGQLHAEELKLGGTGAALGTMQLLADAYVQGHPDVKIVVLPSMGSGGAIKAAMAGAIQLGLSSRPLTEAEVKGGATEIEYGRTPLVFATSAANKTVGVSTQDLVDIYAARTERWPDGTRIRLVLRPLGDVDSEFVKSLSPAMREATSAAERRKGLSFAVTDQDAANSIENVPGALGPSTLAQILSERRQIKALKLNGIVPDAKSIADGTYPLQKRLSFVTGPKTDAAARAFVAFVHSASGRAILERNGHWVR